MPTKNGKDAFGSSKLQSARPLRILCVGDGDLTLSLALIRAYGSQIELTATTLCSSFQELCDTYSNSASVVQELMERQACLLYGVDATKLSQNEVLASKRGFDVITFHHPHLGLMTSLNSTDEQYHAQRHFVLLAHYLASAKSLLQCDNNELNTTTARFYDGRISLCLAHDQPQTWHMERAAHRVGLKLVKTCSTNSPFHSIINEMQLTQSIVPSPTDKPDETAPMEIISLKCLPPEPGYAAPRKYRNGKLGSKHFLGKYGYQHRRTHGDKFDGGKLDMNVEGSKHYFFAIDDPNAQSSSALSGDNADTGEEIACEICGLPFASKAALHAHLDAPAVPDPPATDHHAPMKVDANNNTPSTTTDHISSEVTNSSSSAAPTSRHEKSDLTLDNNLSDDQSGSISSWNVTQEDHGKRLRRFLQSTLKQTQKKVNKLVTDGYILVNGSVARDTSRILEVGDVVSTKEEEVTSKLRAIEATSQPEIPIVSSFPSTKDALRDATKAEEMHGKALPNNYIVVVNKPVGVRTKGIYESSRTLEQIITNQMKARYQSLSSMDTGINGLCALRLVKDSKVDSSTFPKFDIVSEFTALVHGHVPNDWDQGISVEVPVQSVRKWGRQIEQLEVHEEGAPSSTQSCSDPDDMEDDVANEIHTDSPPLEDSNDEPTWMMRISCTEKTSLKRRQQDDKPAPALCTLKISTSCAASGLCRAIILYLRKASYPVVGDRLCQKQYQALPRAIRNRIKKRLLFGCFSIQLIAKVDTPGHDDNNGAPPESSGHQSGSHFKSQVDIPQRYSADYWGQFSQQGDTILPS